VLIREQAHVYNEAYAPLLGEIHPCQGQQPSVALAEVWAQFDKIIRDGQESGQAVVGGKQFLFLKRDGFEEETYFRWKFIPIIGEEGSVIASYVTVTEVTRAVLVDRRMRTIRRVGEHLANANNLTEVWARLLSGLEQNEKDVPLALLYSVKKATTTTCVLEGTIGLAASDQIATERIDLENGTHVLAEAFRDCRTKEGPLLLQLEDGSLPVDLLRNVNWRGFGVPSNAAVVCPIRSRPSGTIMAVLLIALNPRKQYDDDYKDFIDMLTEEITTSHVSTMLLAEEVEQRQSAANQAAIERAELSERLRLRTTEYEQSEAKISRFADLINVGFAMVDTEGHVLYANEAWRRMFSVPRGNLEPRPWLKAILPEDQGAILGLWRDLCVEKKAMRKSLRLNVSLNAGSVKETETQARYMTCRFDAYPDLDKDGHVKSIIACAIDISELKRTEEQVQLRTRELEQSELKYRHFAENAPVGVSMINQEGKIQFANRAWLSITGQSEEEIEHTPWLKSFHHEDVSMLEFLFIDLMGGKKPFTVESRVQRSHKAKDSRSSSPERPAWILVSAYPELTNSGTVKNVICWLTDISAQKREERNLRKRMDDALEMKRQQENFIDMISHEIRNPLSAQLHCAEEVITLANGYISAIESARPTPEPLTTIHAPARLKNCLGKIIEAAQIISYCVHHQKRIVDDVLTLSKLDSNLLTISPTPVQPAKLAQDAFKMFEGELRTADISLTFEEDQSIRDLKVDWVNLHPGRILQILINLAGNSLKFTRGEAERSITVSVSASLEKPSTLDYNVEYFPQSKGRRDSAQAPPSESIPGEILYMSWAVRDSGRGISRDEKKVLFQRFSQGSPKTHSKYGGSGLGLFISSQLIEMQGGKIGVTSERGKGAKFVFYVKGARRHAHHTGERSETVPEGKILEPMPKPTLAPARRPSQSPTKLMVLIVEDNTVNQKVLSRQLRNHGHIVSVANHGGEALEALQNAAIRKDAKDAWAFDVVLMDLEMPVMNGITAIGEIRKLEVSGQLHGHVPVIACTASVRDVEAAIDAGMVGCGVGRLDCNFANPRPGQFRHQAFQDRRYPPPDRKGLQQARQPSTS
jgi:PAS domain S-box-containing protein